MAPGLLQGIEDYRWDMPKLQIIGSIFILHQQCFELHWGYIRQMCIAFMPIQNTRKKVAMVRERSNHEGVCSSRNIRKNESGLMAVKKNLTK